MSGDPSGCHPLVGTQVVAGATLALGRGSSAGQTIDAQGPSGVASAGDVADEEDPDDRPECVNSRAATCRETAPVFRLGGSIQSTDPLRC
jgi:hypothetical protein